MKNKLNKIYLDFFNYIGQKLSSDFSNTEIDFKIIGYTALMLSGLPDRGTKDVDALKVGVFEDEKNKNLVDYINTEFGIRSLLDIKFGMYLDLVPKNIPWLPPIAFYHNLSKFNLMNVYYLDSIDVCVSKIFSHFKKENRFNDLKDIKTSLDERIVNIKDLIKKVDETFIKYETHAEASQVFPKVINYLNNELIPDYSMDSIFLKYTIPNWMNNI